MSEHFDIIVVGAGLAGTLAALSFARDGYYTLCIDPSSEPSDDTPIDPRSTAILQPAQAMLADLSLWPILEPYATPLNTMRLVDVDGVTSKLREDVEFASTEINELPFGWNIQNKYFKSVLYDTVLMQKNLTMAFNLSLKSLTLRSNVAIVTLSNGNRVTAKLIVGADGRHSSVSSFINPSPKQRHYGQHALVFTVQHDIPHDFTSTEIHKSGGPFTLVPIHDHNGMPQSAVVWMDKSENINALYNLNIEQFEEAATIRSAHLFGELTLTSGRAQWPMLWQMARHFSGRRVILMGEAAHVVPPIGAQGLNMSLKDIQTMRELFSIAREQNQDIGSDEITDKYHKIRYPDLVVRMNGIDLLNRASMLENPSLQAVRSKMIHLIHEVPFLRISAIKAGLG